MQTPSQQPAAFARSFFLFLEKNGIASAILHGGEDGFEHDLSDIDFVVGDSTYEKLPALISEYCELSGWRLCQILRHETTAAYFVCTNASDPKCSVALDACSDYQRNGTLFLRFGELLKNRRALPWGGHGLLPGMELRYRFTKAAAKKKDNGAAALEFAAYPEEARNSCQAWLTEQWGISLESWDSNNLATAFESIRKKSNSRPSLMQRGAAGRILSRIHRPTGLIVVAGEKDFENTADFLKRVFGNLHFRRFRAAGKWQTGMLKDLITSTLVVVPTLAHLPQTILPADCVYFLNPESPTKDLAAFLHQRCERRENI